MKRALIGGFLSLIGSIWSLAVIFIAGNNLVNSWDSRVGRLMSTVIEMDLMFLLILSIALIVFGLVLLVVELFRKEK